MLSDYFGKTKKLIKKLEARCFSSSAVPVAIPPPLQSTQPNATQRHYLDVFRSICLIDQRSVPKIVTTIQNYVTIIFPNFQFSWFTRGIYYFSFIYLFILFFIAVLVWCASDDRARSVVIGQSDICFARSFTVGWRCSSLGALLTSMATFHKRPASRASPAVMQ